MTDHGLCEDCGSPSRWPRARGRCRTCYPKHVAGLKEAGAFKSHWRQPAWQRVLDRVVAGPSGCVIWTGTTHKGYGNVDVDGTPRPVHRVVYEALVGPIPEGLQLDHLCHTRDHNCTAGPKCLHRRCVNPAHLEPVTAEENNRRSRSFTAANAAKTHCLRGHLLAGTNLSYVGSQRVCLACKRIHGLKARDRKRGGPKPASRRPTHCKRGHEFTPENTYVSPRTGQRICRQCRDAAARERRRQTTDPAA